jgi:TrmH family RNA methyltransferase
MKNWKDNVTFILVEPREPGNIGASARALKNMGFRRLSLVNPAPVNDEAKWFARNALEVLTDAPVYQSLELAIGDKAIVTGTTRRKGKKRGVIYPVAQGAQRLRDLATDNSVAILFGREDRGLFNEEVEECGFLMSIPADDEQPSLNLAQAVLIVAYELSRAEYRESESGGTVGNSNAGLVSHAELDLLYTRISETLKLLEYIPMGDRDIEKKIMANLKHFMGRAGITDWELNMLHGICSRIEKILKGSRRIMKGE